MAGIYIHVPFCKQACNYCNFYFSTSTNLKDNYLRGLEKEIDLRSKLFENETIETMYFGGGTPSQLSAKELSSIIKQIDTRFKVDPNTEITLEANPDDLTVPYLSALAQTPINRLSIGVQSFVDADLAYMKRAHNANEAIDAIRQAQKSGFHNISLDLIYGTPTLTDKNWIANIEQALALNVQHISCYALTVEPDTPLYHDIRKGKTSDVDEEHQANHFSILVETLVKNGFEHYEISNFARNGFRSRHNQSYWQQKPYLGLGPAAHSYQNGERRWNVSSIKRYADALESGEVYYESEKLTEADQYNELIMTLLRLKDGLNLTLIEQQFGAAQLKRLKDEVEKLDSPYLHIQNNHLIVTEAGRFFCDGLASALFEVDE